jgi:hypothetical protein
MTDPKRLLGFKLRGIDARGAHVTLALETEGGELHEFAAADEVFGALVRFLEGVEESLLQRQALSRGSPAPEVPVDPLQPSEDTDIVIDLTGDRPLLKLRTGRGRQLQVEVSEELLARLEARLPAVIAELRRRRGNQPH